MLDTLNSFAKVYDENLEMNDRARDSLRNMQENKF